MLTCVWNDQAVSMNYLKSACSSISRQWHGRTISDIDPKILNDEKMQEILLFRHIKSELKRIKRGLEAKKTCGDQEEENDGDNTHDIDPTTLWKIFFEHTLPSLNKLNTREKSTITNYFCTHTNNEHENQGCKKIKPATDIKTTLELIDYLIDIIQQPLIPGTLYTQQELDDCKDARDQMVHISTKYPNENIKGKIRVALAGLITFSIVRASIYYNLYGISLTTLHSVMMETLWCVPNVVTGMYLPLLIPVMLVMLRRL